MAELRRAARKPTRGRITSTGQIPPWALEPNTHLSPSKEEALASYDHPEEHGPDDVDA